MGFPCNQFGQQEPGTNEEILAFATTKYGVTFPMFAKIEVNGDGAAPLFRFLRQARPNADGSTEIQWNFTKFLVDRQGNVVKRYAPKVTPEEIGAELGSVLQQRE
jgi:glutathione peroxidase